MAKRRTKKDKQVTQTKRATEPTNFSTYTINEALLDSQPNKKKKASRPAVSVGYDTNLIVTDLKKTLFISGLIFALELLIYYATIQGLLSPFGF